MFNEKTRLDEKCDQRFNVVCGNRTEMQPPKGTNKNCPRKNGAFVHPNPAICDVYYNCIDDDPKEMRCITGLHFDEKSGNCVWPNTIDREGCKTAEGTFFSIFFSEVNFCCFRLFVQFYMRFLLYIFRTKKS